MIKLRGDGKLDKLKEDRFNWIIQALSLKELTDLVRIYSYEQFKLASKSKKKPLKEIALEELNFFSLNDLPDSFNYLEFKISLRTSAVAVKSDNLVLSMASNFTALEYKARNAGNDIILNIQEV